jgi:hypothetical protein
MIIGCSDDVVLVIRQIFHGSADYGVQYQFEWRLTPQEGRHANCYLT